MAYAVAMGAVGVASAQFGTSLAVQVFSKVFIDQERDARQPSRVEKRLKQMALSRHRVERAVRGEIRAYSVPAMDAARLAVAMDQTEHPAIVQERPAQVASAEDALKTDSRERSDGKIAGVAANVDDAAGAKGTRVAAFVAVLPEAQGSENAAIDDESKAAGDASASDDNTTSNERSVTAKTKKPRKGRNTSRYAKVRNAPKKHSKHDLRIADTPNDIILRQLGGTT